MKKFALILASLTFFAGCARNDTPDMTETETDTDYGIGTPAGNEIGTDREMDITPTEPADPSDTTLSDTNQVGGQQMQQPGQQGQQGTVDQDIRIITTNELNAPAQGQSQNLEPQPSPGQQQNNQP